MPARIPFARTVLSSLLSAALVLAFAGPAAASSHREAPFIATQPQVDATDFYMFRSYEPGRDGYVTLVANYLPLQDPYGGPNYFRLDPNAAYEIHIANDGGAAENITFSFHVQNTLDDNQLTVGGKKVSIPLAQNGSADVSTPNSPALNTHEKYTLDIIRGNRRTGVKQSVANVTQGGTSFDKPVDYIGSKTISNYIAYANKHIYEIQIPGCTGNGRVFVGQRKDPFVVNLGETFDLVNIKYPATELNAAAESATIDSLADANVTSFILEVPAACLTEGKGTIVGAWTTASVPASRVVSSTPAAGLDATTQSGSLVQVSRLGAPLVNEVVIGLKDKNRFNASEPKDDGQFADYVTNPTLPALLEVLFGGAGVKAPTNFPRTDLVAAFLTGVEGVNKPAGVVGSEMLRLNTAIAPTAEAAQNRLGLLGGLLAGAGGDLAGYPNGRRPNDDVVDISLIAVMGGLCVANGNADTYKFGAACKPSAAPLGAAVFGLHDGVDQAGAKVKANGPLLPAFPYLGTPLPGAK